MLLGAEFFYELLCIGQIRLGKNLPTLQKTVLGWVLSGPIPFVQPLQQTTCHLTTNQEIHHLLTKFWEIEEPLVTKDLQFSSEEQICEDIFQATTKRASDGRFIVQIPLKMDPSHLGNSRETAIRRLRSIESKLSKDTELRLQYETFLKTYQSMGHMEDIPSSNVPQNSHFLPHHAVINENNKTTRLRVVFDASARTDNGVSFNDLQYVGPTIQDNLFSILLRFRQGSIAIAADIVKMYRQIQVDKSQWHLQSIVWRDDPSKEIHTFQLCTVTYGTASAPWLAVRCLKQLSLEAIDECQRTSSIISKDFYMDDLLTSCNLESEALEICEELKQILSSGGFELQKWASNSEAVLQYVKSQNPSTVINIGNDQRTKTLGIYWSCYTDDLMYSIKEPPSSLQTITKRSILSDIAQVFDPLGLLGPCIIIGKILLQQLWLQNLHWDESLPSSIDSRWRQLRRELPLLNTVQIPRHVTCPSPVQVELHGYTDASTEAYGACLYLRSVSSSGELTVRLLTAKSKVSPLKSLTIPKLELCGALLLAQLTTKVKQSMNITFNKIFLWCDSTVCLAWIHTEPNRLQVFVQNRVAQIQAQTSPNNWHYIRTDENPADLLSRGVYPSILVNSHLWWSGPGWLKQDESYWPTFAWSCEGEIPELRKRQMCLASSQKISLINMSTYSSLTKLQRVVAYVFRFISNSRTQSQKLLCPLSSSELSAALTYLVKLSQTESFPEEIATLKRRNSLQTSSKLLSLNPFLDDDGLLRVGGRLQNSSFHYEVKHPAIISSKHKFTKLLFEAEHKRLLHAGPQQLLFSIRQRYWPISGRNLAKQTVHSCLRCYRLKPALYLPLMGSLPKERVTPAPPFFTTGVDYAGPILIKSKSSRGATLTKAYIALFICFTTKAIHLELVCDLTKDAFIGAFRRFTARRGKPSEVWSDNGTNFKGAHSELLELASFLDKNQTPLQESINNFGTNWKFIPAFSPHFGGLWEAGIKSAKKHLSRVLGNLKMTFEEYYTILTQVEAILNSRPITPISSCPDDLLALTPSHFLIGRPATALPDPDLRDLPISRLSRYQLLQQVQQHFWARWSMEYISELQQRTKWKTQQSSIQIGSLVIIREDHLPPLQWKIGRVTKLHPGPDGIVRVATIRTSQGEVKRSFARFCVLPIEPSSSCGLSLTF
nr:unnamed protein product [Callosobruchus chinensis]